jgi:hypothetical protein
VRTFIMVLVSLDRRSDGYVVYAVEEDQCEKESMRDGQSVVFKGADNGHTCISVSMDEVTQLAVPLCVTK